MRFIDDNAAYKRSRAAGRSVASVDDNAAGEPLAEAGSADPLLRLLDMEPGTKLRVSAIALTVHPEIYPLLINPTSPFEVVGCALTKGYIVTRAKGWREH